MHVPTVVIPMSLWFLTFLPILVVGGLSLLTLVGASLYLIVVPARTSDSSATPQIEALDQDEAAPRRAA